MTKYIRHLNKYLAKNPEFNSVIHAVLGIGVGILITYPLAGIHPVRWAAVFIVAALLGHVWAATH